MRGAAYHLGTRDFEVYQSLDNADYDFVGAGTVVEARSEKWYVFDLNAIATRYVKVRNVTQFGNQHGLSEIMVLGPQAAEPDGGLSDLPDSGLENPCTEGYVYYPPKTNWALQGRATASSSFGSSGPQLAIDGDVDTSWTF